MGFPAGSAGKERILLQCGRPGFDPWVGKIPWRRERLPIPVLAWRIRGLYSPWGPKESDTTEQLSLSRVGDRSINLSIWKFGKLFSSIY